MTRTLVTSALLYANGPLHFGHIAGAYLPADVYVRTLRMCGDDVLAVCGSDDHGVAITIAAEKAGEEYSAYVAKWNAHMRRTFDAMNIRYDVVSGTSTCAEHAEGSQEFFTLLRDNGYLVDRETQQLYCVHDQMFLADRYVEGTCYVCRHEYARGDECPNCGTWIDPLKFVDPRCKICGNTPEQRTTRHWYLDLPKLRDEFIGDWIRGHPWKSNVAKFIENLLEDVPERAITRDMSWGIPLPGDVTDRDGKVLYVWFDAPIGYVSFTKELMRERGTPDAWKDWWKGEDTRLVHFIGKDNIPFHCLVFPSMLYGTKDGYVLPAEVPANEFYNLKGGKFSTTGGNAFDVIEFVDRYDVDTTRFYICSTMPETSDSEFSLEQLVQTANTSLAGTIGNLATRVLKFIAKNFDGVVPELHEEHREEMDRVILTECGDVEDPAQHIRAFRFRRGAESIVQNASVANVFVDRLAPWALRKEDPAKAASALNTLCEWLAWQARWMAPVMPTKAQALWEMLGLDGAVADQPWPGVPEAGSWRSLTAGHPLGTPEALFPRVEVPAESAP
ncbi:MAG: methionine--tRNA ligase [Planctomycetota bacterium]